MGRRIVAPSSVLTMAILLLVDRVLDHLASHFSLLASISDGDDDHCADIYVQQASRGIRSRWTRILLGTGLLHFRLEDSPEYV